MIKVVLVEDNELEQAMYEAFLDKHGIEVHQVVDPVNALRVIDEVDPDLVLLDIEMPHINGIELCKLIKNESKVPVIFLTGSEDPRHLIASISLGCVDYVNKPVTASSLLSTVTGHGIISIYTDSLAPMKDALENIRRKYST